jgi:type I restriction enzyme S subunit
MEVKPGYKETEVGVIPEEWVVSELRKACRETITYGIVQCGPHIKNGVPYIRVSDMDEPELDVDGMLRTSSSIAARFLRSTVCEGDVVYALRGKLGEVRHVGPSVVGANLTQGTARLSPSQRLASSYLLWAMRSACSLRQAEMEAKGSTFREITLANLRLIKIPVPALPEQRAIAEALGDMDALLGSLEKLIAKKRDLKQAAMQQLLTGKKRLPGFSGEWVLKTLTEVCWFQEGPGVRNSQFTHSGVKLLNGTNIFRGEINLETTERYISDKEAFGPYAHFLAECGDIVIASSGVAIEKFHEKVAFVKESHLPLCMNTSTIRFKPFPAWLAPAFLFQALKSDVFKRHIGSQATGSAQLNFGPSHIAKVQIPVPELVEQTAIAEVLSDMDAELAALEQRLDKTRELKQGMMQELLTGKTRLV